MCKICRGTLWNFKIKFSAKNTWRDTYKTRKQVFILTRSIKKPISYRRKTRKEALQVCETHFSSRNFLNSEGDTLCPNEFFPKVAQRGKIRRFFRNWWENPSVTRGRKITNRLQLRLGERFYLTENYRKAKMRKISKNSTNFLKNSHRWVA